MDRFLFSSDMPVILTRPGLLQVPPAASSGAPASTSSDDPTAAVSSGGTRNLSLPSLHVSPNMDAEEFMPQQAHVCQPDKEDQIFTPFSIEVAKNGTIYFNNDPKGELKEGRRRPTAKEVGFVFSAYSEDPVGEDFYKQIYPDAPLRPIAQLEAMLPPDMKKQFTKLKPEQREQMMKMMQKAQQEKDSEENRKMRQGLQAWNQLYGVMICTGQPEPAPDEGIIDSVVSYFRGDDPSDVAVRNRPLQWLDSDGRYTVPVYMYLGNKHLLNLTTNESNPLIMQTMRERVTPEEAIKIIQAGQLIEGQYSISKMHEMKGERLITLSIGASTSQLKNMQAELGGLDPLEIMSDSSFADLPYPSPYFDGERLQPIMRSIHEFYKGELKNTEDISGQGEQMGWFIGLTAIATLISVWGVRASNMIGREQLELTKKMDAANRDKGKTILEKIGDNLSDRATQGEYYEVTNPTHEKIIQEVLRTLSVGPGRARSMLITAIPGFGKKVIMEQLPLRALAAESNLEFVSVSHNSLTKGTMWRGSKEENIEGAVEEVEMKLADGKDVILFADEWNHFIRAGRDMHNENPTVLEWNQPLADGRLTIIGLTTGDEADKAEEEFKNDPVMRPLIDRFQTRIQADPISVDEMERIIERAVEIDYLKARGRPFEVTPENIRTRLAAMNKTDNRNVEDDDMKKYEISLAAEKILTESEIAENPEEGNATQRTLNFVLRKALRRRLDIAEKAEKAREQERIELAESMRERSWLSPARISYQIGQSIEALLPKRDKNEVRVEAEDIKHALEDSQERIPEMMKPARKIAISHDAAKLIARAAISDNPEEGHVPRRALDNIWGGAKALKMSEVDKDANFTVEIDDVRRVLAGRFPEWGRRAGLDIPVSANGNAQRAAAPAADKSPYADNAQLLLEQTREIAKHIGVENVDDADLLRINERLLELSEIASQEGEQGRFKWFVEQRMENPQTFIRRWVQASLLLQQAESEGGLGRQWHLDPAEVQASQIQLLWETKELEEKQTGQSLPLPEFFKAYAKDYLAPVDLSDISARGASAPNISAPGASEPNISASGASRENMSPSSLEGMDLPGRGDMINQFTPEVLDELRKELIQAELRNRVALFDPRSGWYDSRYERHLQQVTDILLKEAKRKNDFVEHGDFAGLPQEELVDTLIEKMLRKEPLNESRHPHRGPIDRGSRIKRDTEVFRSSAMEIMVDAMERAAKHGRRGK